MIDFFFGKVSIFFDFFEKKILIFSKNFDFFDFFRKNFDFFDFFEKFRFFLIFSKNFDFFFIFFEKFRFFLIFSKDFDFFWFFRKISILFRLVFESLSSQASKVENVRKTKSKTKQPSSETRVLSASMENGREDIPHICRGFRAVQNWTVKRKKGGTQPKGSNVFLFWTLASFNIYSALEAPRCELWTFLI